MEIEVGDYARTEDGEIGKVTAIINGLVFINTNQYWSHIVKHSKILTEVVEVGDYVNGKLIHKIDKGQNYCYLYYGNCKTFVDYQIKTILTKETYEANCYTVEKVKD